ncbi:MAG: hypothetical protein KKB21_04465 [Nanoarchaeota archaeon]|nr:hypothetical protein [Nanoarchaeota archaeon]MBU4086800.1 hypothetical protein [Nanoarchaeota archaeon]
MLLRWTGQGILLGDNVKIVIVLLMFFLIGMFFIISENNLALNCSENIDKFVGMYSLWLSQIFDNAGAMTGNVIRMNWLPEINKTANLSG